MKIKVTHTTEYNNTITVKGKLILINSDIPNSILIKGKDGFGSTHKPYDSYLPEVKGYLPYIVFESDETRLSLEIQPKDMLLHNAGWIAECIKRDGIYVHHKTKLGVEGNNYFYNYKKILAMPENFSPELINKIIHGELKEGGIVFVECEEKYEGGELSEDKTFRHNSYLTYQVKLNKENHINIICNQKASFCDFINELINIIKNPEDSNDEWKKAIIENSQSKMKESEKIYTREESIQHLADYIFDITNVDEPQNVDTLIEESENKAKEWFNKNAK